MTPKQKLYVAAVIAGSTPTQAARIAGYQGGANTTRVIGFKNARNPVLSAAVERGQGGLRNLMDVLYTTLSKAEEPGRADAVSGLIDTALNCTFSLPSGTMGFRRL